MKTIPLTKGKVALIDDEDYELVSKYKWYAHKPNKNKNSYYACTCLRLPNKKSKTIFMHRLILNAPDGMEVDHIKGYGLDNRRSCIRLCTRSQNMMNLRIMNNGSSRYKGVYWDKCNKKWRANIVNKLKYYHIGRFKHEVRAAKAYDDKAKELFREFACLNFPKSLRRRNIYRWLMATNGRVFAVTFIKRSTGEEKTIRARVGVKTRRKGKGLRYNTRDKKLIVVYDMKERTYKSIPIDGIEAVCCRLKKYRVD